MRLTRSAFASRPACGEHSLNEAYLAHKKAIEEIFVRDNNASVLYSDCH